MKIFRSILTILLWIIMIYCVFTEDVLGAILIMLFIINDNIEKLNK